MNAAADPCHDFYEFACGSFLSSNTIPDDKSTYSKFGITDETNKKVLQRILESDFEATAQNLPDINELIDRQNFEKIQGMYDSCMNTSQLEEVGIKPLHKVLGEIITRFPTDRIQSEADLSKVGQEPKGRWWYPGRKPKPLPVDYHQLTEAMTHLASIGVSPFFGMFADADDVHPAKVVLNLQEGSFGLPARELYKEMAIVARYEKTIADMFAIVLDGLNIEQAQGGRYDSIARHIVELEASLNAARSSAVESNNIEFTYNPYNVTELSKLVPVVFWNELFSSLTPYVIPSPIIVHSPSYAGNASEIISTTSADVIQAYFLWTTIQKYAGYLAEPYNAPLRRFNNMLNGRDEETKPKRWETCVRQVDQHLGFILGRWFVAAKYNADAKAEGQAIMDAIKDSFVSRVDTLEWMDKETSRLAKEKAKAIFVDVGYPLSSPNTTSPISLADYYSPVNVYRKQFFWSAFSAEQASSRRQFSKVGRPSNKHEWYFTPQTVNAGYLPNRNQIQMPAGIMQDPFYDLQYPEYVSFGAIGMVSGHELTHAFDNQGRLYDKDGNLRNWWTNQTAAAFKDLATCFVKQYSGFKVTAPDGTKIPVNGTLTLGENLADNSGLQEAFDAWRKRFEEDPKSEKYKNQLLPGLEQYSREQLFYVAAARPWCSLARPEFEVNGVRNDPHSPAKYRVLGAMVNNEDFSKAFGCPVGSRMNPAEKCKMW